jgi:uncharacterized membrane protein YfcA
MEPLLVITGILLICGFIAGFLAGLLGVGGGFLMVPVMFVLLSDMGYQEHAMVIAVATSASVILLTAVSGTFRQWRMGNICWHAALVIGTGGIIGSLVGSSLSISIPEHLHVLLFASFLIFLSFWMIINKTGLITGYHIVESDLVLGICGIFMGIVAGMFGIGGGIILTPVLTTLFGYMMHRSVGVSLAAIVLTAGGSVCSYIFLGWGKMNLFPMFIGYVNLFFAAILLCASVPAAQMGVLFRHRISDKSLSVLFIGMLLALALKMILSA